MKQGRRSFLKVSLSAGSCLVMVANTSCATWHTVSESEREKPLLSFWIEQGEQNRLTFICCQTEMGQGIAHTLAKFFCEEFSFPLDQLELAFAPVADRYRNPAFGIQATGGSTSVKAWFEPLRLAGAASRQILLEAAARKWNISEVDCKAGDGKVTGPAGSGLSASYGALIPLAQGIRVSEPRSLKKAEGFSLIGKSRPKIDNKLKLAGLPVFGIDSGPEDALSAGLRHTLSGGGKAVISNRSALEKMTGFRAILEAEFGVVVVAEKYWQVKKILETMDLKWEKFPAGFSSKTQLEVYRTRVNKTFAAEHETSLAEFAGKGLRTLDTWYQVPYLAHACMEPMNATALVEKDGAQVWAPTQSTEMAREAAASVTGLSWEQIRVHATFCGGGFGRRTYQDFVAKAVFAASKFPGRAVRLIWEREEDMRNGFFRPNGLARLSGAVDPETGKIACWQQIFACPSFTKDTIGRFSRVLFPEWLGRSLRSRVGHGLGSVMKGTFAKEGGEEIPYQCPVFDFRWEDVTTPLPLGFWRSVGHSITAFIKESFMDELAHLAGLDPLTFRLEHLDPSETQYRKILATLADSDLWKNRKVGDGTGIAIHSSFDSCVGQVVKVSGDEAGIRVEKALIVIDCGYCVDPDGLMAQMEGGFIFGLSAALKGEISVKNGSVVESNFHDYQMIRMNESPDIETVIISSPGKKPGGGGEPAVPPVAAAVANAYFDLTGNRIRTLPVEKNLQSNG